MTLDELFQIIEDRKANPKPGSYTAHLLENGEQAVLKKVGEEAIEVILAASSQGDQRVIEEVADLFYHTLVLLASRDLMLSDVWQELAQRHTSR